MRPFLRIAAAVVLGVLALYLTIWPHELGHSAVAFLLGCKQNWWSTDMSWFLWDSWGGPIDYRCLAARGPLALALTDFGGIAVNLVLLAAAPLLGRWHHTPHKSPGSRWLFVFTVFLALGNFAEAFSYLTINTAWLTSDMVNVVAASRVSHWQWLFAGIIFAVAIAFLLASPVKRSASYLSARPTQIPAWTGALILYALLTGMAMAAARVALTT